MFFSINKNNFPLAALLFLFVSGRLIWGLADSRTLLLTSGGARLEDVENTFFCEVWHLKMPDGSLHDKSTMHWYFLPVLLMAGLLVQRRKSTDELFVPVEEKKSEETEESVLIRCGKKVFNAMCWLLSFLPLFWIADFWIFILRARNEVLLPKWENTQFPRTSNPWTWPDPKDLGLGVQYDSVLLIFLGVVVGTCVVLPLLLGSVMSEKNPARMRIAYVAMISIVAMVVVCKYAWSYIIWIMD